MDRVIEGDRDRGSEGERKRGRERETERGLHSCHITFAPYDKSPTAYLHYRSSLQLWVYS